MLEEHMVPGKFVIVVPTPPEDPERGMMWFARRIWNFVGVRVGRMSDRAEFVCPEDPDKLEKAKRFIRVLQDGDPGMEVHIQDSSCFPSLGC